ncbi:acyltransferase family protein [Escherichia coli]|uniref:acyltransferase family protein n=1 Tax=Escherichia coli TaxID=562 RepID=UPI0011028846|nr:acyltransferase [Escherichia coli]EGK3483097.1 acyltransferase [Escherichia coli]EGO4636626.1 acyltransferase [Escherichia coli]EHV2969897.1 acyltransferase [Escherichia coli]EHY3708783.1 acyltransferase [Escherichia coli]EIN4508332.1 acyltransferase [Escherichia coli]
MTNQFAITIAISCFVIAMVIFSLPVFKFLDEEAQPKRTNSLDGMRFILASLVIFHHMDCFYSYYTTGKWEPVSYFLFAAGKYGVALFFMTTAYLFWGKVRIKDSVDWVSLYRGRFFRIIPLAVFASFVAIISLFIFTKPFPLYNTPISNIFSWFDGSLWDHKPPVTTMQRPTIALAGVTWTLRWEWMFYFTLPALFFFRKLSFEISIILLAFSIYLMPSITKDAYLWSFFFAGMVCRELKERVYITESNAEWFLLASIILIIVVDPTLFRVPGTIFLAFIFFSILSGGSLFGLLKTRAAIRLGTISYSLYITQGLILFPAYNLYIKEFTLNLDSSYFIFLCMSYAAICFLSATTYHFIELPFMKIGGRKSTKKLNQANVLDK